MSHRRATVRHRLAALAATLVWLAAAAPAAAAEPVRITLDPGHGGPEIGASYTFSDGAVLREKDLNLRVAVRLRDLLARAGYAVSLTRAADSPVDAGKVDLTGDGIVNLADDLQARIDAANRAGSDLFVSLHFNGDSDPSLRGTVTFWDPGRPFADRSQALAEQVQAALVRDLRAAGYATQDRGARTDTSVLGGDAYYLLSPRSPIVSRPSAMPAIIAEPLFLTNPADATALRDDRVVEGVARGYFDGIRAYVAQASTPARTPVGQAPAAVTPPPPAPRADAGPSRPATDAALPPSGRFWTVWAVTYRDTPDGQRLATGAVRDLAARGVPAEVLTSRLYSSLLPGFAIVSSGRFTTRDAAAARAAQVRAAGYPDAYLRTLGAN